MTSYQRSQPRMPTGARQRMCIREIARRKCKYTLHRLSGAGVLEALQIGMAGASASSLLTASLSLRMTLLSSALWLRCFSFPGLPSFLQLDSAP